MSCLTERSRSGSDVSAEVLGDDDVGGHLRPELRHLDVFLLEHDRARLVRDHGRPELPLARVVHVDAGLRVEALDHDSAAARLLAACFRRLGGRTGSKRLGHVDGCHVFPPSRCKSAPPGALSRRRSCGRRGSAVRPAPVTPTIQTLVASPVILSREACPERCRRDGEGSPADKPKTLTPPLPLRFAQGQGDGRLAKLVHEQLVRPLACEPADCGGTGLRHRPSDFARHLVLPNLQRYRA